MVKRELKNLKQDFTPQFLAGPTRRNPRDRGSNRQLAIAIRESQRLQYDTAPSGSPGSLSRLGVESDSRCTTGQAYSQEPLPRKKTDQPGGIPPTPQGEMSQRNRSGRGLNRNNGSSHGEEVNLWDSVKEKLPEALATINEDTRNLEELLKLDEEAAEYRKKGREPPSSLLAKMDKHCRNGVKGTETIKQEIAAMIEKINILRAILQANKDQGGSHGGSSAPPPVRSAASARPSRDLDATASSSVYDLDAAAESPVRSPVGGSSRRFTADRSSNRDSVPPRHSDSAEPAPASSTGSAAPTAAGGAGTPASGSASATALAQMKSRVVFAKGDAVAFRPKQVGAGEQMDWILGEVAAVLGDGKTRRYKVMDVEPDEAAKQREFRTSASNMIPITPESTSASLPPWEKGKIVLALYPHTTTFYKAEVMNTADGKVDLRFEGESDSATLQQVDRRFVVEYRP
ncbi:uncharacterized protein DNG_09367 [Cephalotrichum gorgonifer]|uniref:SGF29 C-terminal domain-containing protein n=1 Tax=Cephalotrichum gorgonifer TaxID=2041049 RepID=A0AAE8SZ78_9PEZI|nr:uncharacterized protein DNG_09367 [Cephalotrichum gorgonifer]